LKENLAKLVAKSGDSVAISYDNARLTLVGNALIRGGSIYIPAINVQVTFDEIEYGAGSLLNLLFTGEATDEFQYLKTYIYVLLISTCR
jgi:hypothetical protein